MDSGECCVCGKTDGLQVHHIIPIGKGGDDRNESNLVTVCSVCERQIHREELTLGITGGINTGRWPARVIYNVAILREMRLTCDSENPRIEFLEKRMKIPKTKSPMELSKKVLNLAFVLDNEDFEVDRLPWTFDFGNIDVVLKRKGADSNV